MAIFIMIACVRFLTVFMSGNDLVLAPIGVVTPNAQRGGTAQEADTNATNSHVSGRLAEAMSPPTGEDLDGEPS
jgi:hypothetical protein